MHFSVEWDVLNNLATVGFEGGTKVVDIDSGKLRHKPICDPGREAAHHHVIGALGSPATDDVVAFFELGDKL